MVYELIGKISVALAALFVILVSVSLILGLILIKKKKFILPKLLLFTVDNFYFQVKGMARRFGLGDKIVDQIGIEVRNRLYLQDFSKIKPQDKILVMPQCVRHIKCPARLDPNSGIKCKECGMCIIKDLKEEAERLGYKIYVVPGGRFVERIVKAAKPKAAIGVACYKDLNLAMHEISKADIIVQGVPLIKDGCINTEFDVKELINKMRFGVEEGIKTAKSCAGEKPRIS